MSVEILWRFVEEECIPAETVFENELKSSGKRWGVVPPVVEALKARAKYVRRLCVGLQSVIYIGGLLLPLPRPPLNRALGLWNAFLLKEDEHHVPAGAPGYEAAASPRESLCQTIPSSSSLTLCPACAAPGLPSFPLHVFF